jgi:hypothetical protein
MKDRGLMGLPHINVKRDQAHQTPAAAILYFDTKKKDDILGKVN